MTDAVPAGLGEHALLARGAMPGAVREGDAWRLRWRGAALVGIVNVTPDSFSDGGRFDRAEAAVAHGRRLVAEGAAWLDVGGESTRPGADPVPEDEELRRVLPVVERLAADGAAVLSIDTTKPAVADAALAAGAHVVNDVGGLRLPAMVETCARRGAPAVVMHRRGDPKTMQRDPRYRDVVAEVEAFLRERAAAALAVGVPDVVLDPGVGFGKTVAHNLALLRATSRLASHGRPLLVGASRKGFLGRLTGVDEPSARVAGTLAVHLEAARLGAALLRVHDVAAHREALAVQAALAAPPEVGA